jgi:hypothetical protein
MEISDLAGKYSAVTDLGVALLDRVGSPIPIDLKLVKNVGTRRRRGSMADALDSGGHTGYKSKGGAQSDSTRYITHATNWWVRKETSKE